MEKRSKLEETMKRWFSVAPIELCVLPPMDWKPRKSSFQRTFWIAIPIFLEEVMTDLVTEGQAWNVYSGSDRPPSNLPRERSRQRPKAEEFPLDVQLPRRHASGATQGAELRIFGGFQLRIGPELFIELIALFYSLWLCCDRKWFEFVA